MENLNRHIEALIFASENPISEKELTDCLNHIKGEEFEKEVIDKAIEELTERYKSDDFAFSLVKTGGGYQFLTKNEYHLTISVFLNQKARKRLSTAALETLAIIAYKQPITKSEVESIRGVNCDYTIQKLLEKELVSIKGRLDAPGRPLLYETSEKFMDFFGLNSRDDLPKPKELEPEKDNTIGEPNE